MVVRSNRPWFYIFYKHYVNIKILKKVKINFKKRYCDSLGEFVITARMMLASHNREFECVLIYIVFSCI